MATTTTFDQGTINAKVPHNSAKSKIFFAPYGNGSGNQNTKGGYVTAASPSAICAAMEFCTVSEMPEWTQAAINEQTIVAPGKKNLTTRDGTSASGNLSFHANAVGTFRVLAKLYAADGMAIQWSVGDFGLVGSLIVHRYSDAGDLISSTCYVDVKAKIESVAGVVNQGLNFQPVTFYIDESKIHTLTSGNLWMPFVFVYNGASLTNAAAPDASITTFKLHDCNHSQTTTPPQLVLFDDRPSGATNWKRYFATLRVDGVEVSTSAATWATDTLTFGTAPADGARLYGIAAINPASYTVPTYHNSTGGMLNLIEQVVGIL